MEANTLTTPTHSRSPTLLSLPPELRTLVFLYYFRSITICRRLHRNQDESDWERHLGILLVCRQIYHEAAQLLLPNARVFCNSNADLIDTLMSMSPAQIRQLRYMLIYHCPVGLNLYPDTGKSQPNALGESSQMKGRDLNEVNASNASDAVGDESEAEDRDDDDEKVRYFHLGAILGLFPGLQLDLLEVFCGVGGGPYTGFQTTDCFGSVLEADGYRRLWMCATTGDGSAWLDIPSTWRWKEIITAKFKPYNGWRVRIRLPSYEWSGFASSDSDENSFWARARDAGFTIVENEDDSDGDDAEDEGGYRSADVADIAVERGDANFAVKADDGRVMRCIAREDNTEESDMFYTSVWNAAKKLFREHSWESIQAMEGFDDGSFDSWNEGDAVYAMRF
ncbi:conserved hypothetical protein [Histoplasma capsulatum var. duboisii H88]|uniref:F-box domain-containing protein n=2 Tax=Ajellomyces capsulatus (strain H88) TaxID=544711 RepID=F0UGJ7_AJEC8|nr:conserved hypothetical protein [Histoplasma capsulatum var. duboisii H88]